MHRGSRARRLGALALLALVSGGWAVAQDTPAEAPAAQPAPQEAAAGPAALDDDLADGLILAADRMATQRLQQARQLLAEERFSETAQVLGLLLESPEDFFFQPDPRAPVHKSVKAEAERMIGELPPAGKDAYCLLFDAQAKRQLHEALATGGESALAAVSRQYFHTRAGQEATWLLAKRYLDQGRGLAAAMALERLRRSPTTPTEWREALAVQTIAAWRAAGQTAEAAERLSELARENDLAKLPALEGAKLGGDEEPRAALERLLAEYDPADAQPATDEAGWRLFRGSPDRNAESAGGAPLLTAVWKLRLASDPSMEKLLEEIVRSYRTQVGALLPAAHPLVVQDVVLTRDANTLLAADFFTGKLLWEVPVDQTFDELLDSSGRGSPVGAPVVAAGLEQRICDDVAFGSMSSDGQRVFLLDDLGVLPGAAAANLGARQLALRGQRIVRLGAPATADPGSNRLAAYDVKTGKLEWELGGRTGPRSLPLADTFFLGPPLPLAGELYVLVEQQSEIRLLALDAATGRLDWSQPLAVLERSIDQEPMRRLAGVSPSYHDGVLVCPTAAGGVVAVDLTARALLWGYRYRNLADGGMRGGFPAQPLGPLGSRRVRPHWADSTATIVGNRVLLTPMESDEIHCLDLATGEVLWRRSREEGLYLGGVHGDRVIVVGSQRVRLFDLASGQPAVARGVALPAGAKPSGRGFLTGSRYFVPLDDGQIVAIDVEQGAIVEQVRSRRRTTPGNLICHRGTILSQSVLSVETYYQQSALEERLTRMLAANPRDARSLTLRGELALGQGRIDDALADLRQAAIDEGDLHARRLLAETLLEALATDFARYESTADEVERLLETPAQRARFAQLMATGWQAQGKTREALSQYLDIADSDEPHGLLQVSDDYQVRADRWVRGGVGALAESATEADRRVIEQAVAERYQRAVAANSVPALARFLDCFGQQSQAGEARARMASLLDGRQRALAVERLWLDIAQRGSRPEQARAARGLAELYANLAMPRESAVYYHRLADEFADVDDGSGRSGREIVSALSAKDPVRGWLAPRKSWPPHLRGLDRMNQGGPVFRLFEVPLGSRSTPLADDWNLSIDQRGQYLVARDGQGREKLRALLTEPSERVGPGFHVAISTAQLDGHLLVVSLGDEVLAIDALPSGDQRLARILWRRSLVESLPGWIDGGGIRPGVDERPWGAQRMSVRDAVTNRPVGSIGPITREALAVQRGREIVGIDPESGETLWSRSDLPAGCELFGDEDLLFAAVPDTTQAFVLRMSDGQRLGERVVPMAHARMQADGRQLICWTVSGGKTMLQRFDPWTQEVIWEHELGGDSKASLIGGDEVAVVEPQGRVRVFDLASGQARIDARVEALNRLHQAHVLRSADHYVIVGSQEWINDGRLFVAPIPGGLENPVISGPMWGFARRGGELLWTKKIDRQALLLSQPPETPVVVLASRVFERGQPHPMGGEANQNRAQFLVIDKRTGQTLLDERGEGNITTYELTATPQADSVTLRFPRTALVFRFGDEPAEGVNTKEEDPKPPRKKGGKS